MGGMRRRLSLVVLSLALLVGAGLPVAPAQEAGEALALPEHEVRGSILIEGDDAFTAENGVRGGGGTAEDPYVISGWHVVVTREGYGVRLANTTAHVVVGDLTIDDRARFGGSLGVDLQGARHVTVESVRILRDARSGTAVRIWDASNVTVRDADLRGHGPVPKLSFSTLDGAVEISNSENVTFRNVTFPSDQWILRAWRTRNLQVLDSHLQGPPVQDAYGFEKDPGYVQLHEAADVHMEGNTILRAGVEFLGAVRNVSLLHNRIHAAVDPPNDAPYSLVDFDPHVVEVHDQARLLLCGNELSGGLVAIDASRVSDIQLVANAFHNQSTENVHLQRLDGLLFERNILEAHGFSGSTFYVIAGDAVIRHNHFAEYGEDDWPTHIAAETPVDASHNWWDHPTGPSGDGPGDGQPLTWSGDVDITPWLDTPPAAGPGSVDCHAELAKWRSAE